MASPINTEIHIRRISSHVRSYLEEMNKTGGAGGADDDDDEKNNPNNTNHPIYKSSLELSMSPSRTDDTTTIVQNYACEFAQEQYEEDFLSSGITDKSQDFPSFSTTEILKGPILGKGGFSVVYQVNGFQISLQRMNSTMSISTSTRTASISNILPTHPPPPPLDEDATGTATSTEHDNNNNNNDTSHHTSTNSVASMEPSDLFLFRDSLKHEHPQEEDEDEEVEEDPSVMDLMMTMEEEMESRQFMAQHCFRQSGDARYAIKQLKADIISNDDKLYQGIYDLNLETRILSSLPHHPNIIKLRAIAHGNAFSPDYFLVLDRLYDTLEQRIYKTWKRERDVEIKGGRRLGWKRLYAYVRRNHSQRESVLYRHSERLWAAYDLSSALAHLHSHSIMHRDLKPDNIGFDVRGDIKIFDFGLAREIPKEDPGNGGPWNFTGMCGTPRYMAPEVANGEPYNESCDVYSFAMVVWEILTLKKPYHKMNLTKLQTEVWNEKIQLRPKLNAKWSDSIRLLLQESWNGDVKKRPTMVEVELTLKQALMEGVSKEETSSKRFSHQSRRSTFVFVKGNSNHSKHYSSHHSNSNSNSHSNTISDDNNQNSFQRGVAESARTIQMMCWSSTTSFFGSSGADLNVDPKTLFAASGSNLNVDPKTHLFGASGSNLNVDPPTLFNASGGDLNVDPKTLLDASGVDWNIDPQELLQ